MQYYRKTEKSFTPVHPGEDAPATHVLLTVDEYIDNREDVKKLKEAVKKEELKQGSALSDIKALEEKIGKLEAERDAQISLNANLLRIARERANAARGLQPKKKHCGYRICNKITQIKAISGHNQNQGAVYSYAWTVTLESPYDISIPLVDLESTITDDLTKKGGVFELLGVEYSSEEKRIKTVTYIEAVKSNKEKKSLVYDYRFSANVDTHLWEIQLYSTGEFSPAKELIGVKKQSKHTDNVPAFIVADVKTDSENIEDLI